MNNKKIKKRKKYRHLVHYTACHLSLNNFYFVCKKTIHYMYGFVNGNTKQARRLYQERFCNRMTPDRQIFFKAVGRLSRELPKRSR